MKYAGGGWKTVGPYQKYLNERIYWYVDGQFLSGGSGYYTNQWQSIASTSLPWMCNPTFALFGKGHPGNSANFIFGDNHVESLTRQGIAGRTTGDAYSAAGAPFLVLNGWATAP